MKIQKRSVLLVIFFLLARTAPAFAQASGITLRVQGIQEANGQLLIGVHRESSSFPSDWDKAERFLKIPVKQTGEQTVEISDLPPGPWAIIVVHDLDMDGSMTKNWIGFPREPFGTSNNPTFRGPPRFSRAVIEITPGQEVLVRLVKL